MDDLHSSATGRPNPDSMVSSEGHAFVRAADPRYRIHFLSLVLLLAAVGVALIVGTYYLEKSRSDKLSVQNSVLAAQITELTGEIKQQTDINNGTVAAGKVYKDPAGGIGLVNGAITLTLPKGWVRIPQADCTGGTIDSTAVCQDIAAVAPSHLVRADGSASWSVRTSVFSYSSNDGSAKNWYEGIYDHNPLASYGSPEAVNISTDPINGYSALSFQFVSPPLDNPDYTAAHFALVHGKYAVEVDAWIQAGKEFGGGTAFDYRTSYLPEIIKMMQSIKFQDES